MQYSFNIEQLNSSVELSPEDLELFNAAQDAIKLAYTPYSNFSVGAAARLDNGEIVLGSNQENVAFAASICAERTLLAHISSLYPYSQIQAIAISYINSQEESSKPISPCGVCRQVLLEYEARTNHPVKIIMGGKTGEIWIVKNASCLLPLAFSPQALK